MDIIGAGGGQLHLDAQKKRGMRLKMRLSPSIMLREPEVIKTLDKSKKAMNGKQSLTRERSGVFLGGSQVKDGIKI